MFPVNSDGSYQDAEFKLQNNRFLQYMKTIRLLNEEGGQLWTHRAVEDILQGFFRAFKGVTNHEQFSSYNLQLMVRFIVDGQLLE